MFKEQQLQTFLDSTRFKGIHPRGRQCGGDHGSNGGGVDPVWWPISP